MAFSLTPKDNGFYDLFSQSAKHLTAGAAELTAILGADTQEERETIAARLSEIETSADEATHELIRKVNSSFITPFDREDIHGLASALDDCIDHMEAAADLVALYRESARAAYDDAALRLGLLAGIVWLGWNKALDIVEHPDPAVRERERAALPWWLHQAELALGTGLI